MIVTSAELQNLTMPINDVYTFLQCEDGSYCVESFSPSVNANWESELQKMRSRVDGVKK